MPTSTSRAPTRCASTAATSPRPAPTAPSATRTPAENLARFREMRDGLHADGAMVLRAKIDMASPEHQPARPDAVPHQARHAPQHRRPLVHLPDVHLCAPAGGRAGEHHPQHLHAGVRGPAPLLRLGAGAPGRSGPAGAAAAEAVRIRAPEPDLHRHQQAQAAADGGRRHRRRLGRPAHAHAGRHAPARLHAREPAPAGRTQRRQQGRRLDRLQLARHRAARGPGRQGAARDGRARPAETGADQLGHRHRQGPDAALHARRCTPASRSAASATSRSAPRSGSSARTSWKSR